jgi:hypothetical protein
MAFSVVAETPGADVIDAPGPPDVDPLDVHMMINGFWIGRRRNHYQRIVGDLILDCLTAAVSTGSSCSDGTTTSNESSTFPRTPPQAVLQTPNSGASEDHLTQKASEFPRISGGPRRSCGGCWV